MAVYGYSLYGRSKYGGRIQVDFGVAPFTAEAASYDRVTLNWNEPSGDWETLRLLESRSGYSSNENDGNLVLEVAKPDPTPRTLSLSAPGGWSYYTIFLYSNVTSQWERAAITDVLVPYDYESANTLWELLPLHYKQVRPETAGFSNVAFNTNPAIYLTNTDTEPNLHLANFLRVLGWGVDMARTQIDSTLDGYDTSVVHISRLALLAKQFGAEIEQDATAQVNRNIVRNLALLHRKRGTLDGIRELISLSTGAEIEVYLGPNMMLSEDQANFVNPQVQDWDITVRYVEGDRVRYNGWYFEAIQTAYGFGQQPPLEPDTSNVYWTRDPFIEAAEDISIIRPDTGGIGTWQVLTDAGVQITQGIFVGMGTPDPVDGTIVNANSLAFRNTTEATTNLTARSIPYFVDESTFDRELVIKSGVPVPTVPDHVAGENYFRGDVVLYRGAQWEALTTTESLPASPDWRRVSIDDRPRVVSSFYARGPINGTPGTGGVLVTPWVGLFDQSGDVLVDRALTTASDVTGRAYDAFQAGTLVAAKALDLGTPTWGVTGTWDRAYTSDAAVVYPLTTSFTTGTVATGAADGIAGVTFGSVGTRTLGIRFRSSGDTNYWIAGQTGLKKKVAGVLSDPASGAAAYSAFQAGERMTVEMNGSTITVKRDGVTVATATDSFNSTATVHGIVVEA